MTESKNYKLGAIITGGFAIVASLFVDIVGSWLLHPIAGTLLAIIAFIATILYGIKGLRTIPVGSKGKPLWLGKRVDKSTCPEGLIWTWPKPFGDLIIIDVRDKPVNLPLTEVLTKDNVPVSINISLQTKITDLDVYLSSNRAEESLQNATESDIRTIVAQLQSETIPQEKQNITNAIEGKPAVRGLEKLTLQALTGAEAAWGITVSKVRITHIRLPEEMENANTEIQVQTANQKKETAQAVAEKIEARHVAEMMAIYKTAGLSPTEAINALQTERGKATRIILDGRADPLVQAGALAGPLLNAIKPQTQSPSSDSAPKGQRRRGNT